MRCGEDDLARLRNVKADANVDVILDRIMVCALNFLAFPPAD
jgi:hypothetical protein